MKFHTKIFYIISINPPINVKYGATVKNFIQRSVRCLHGYSGEGKGRCFWKVVIFSKLWYVDYFSFKINIIDRSLTFMFSQIILSSVPPSALRFQRFLKENPNFLSGRQHQSAGFGAGAFLLLSEGINGRFSTTARLLFPLEQASTWFF